MCGYLLNQFKFAFDAIFFSDRETTTARPFGFGCALFSMYENKAMRIHSSKLGLLAAREMDSKEVFLVRIHNR